jgi:hypothetical protein
MSRKYRAEQAAEVGFRLAAGSVSWRSIVRAVATMHGRPLPDDGECDWLLWERTAWPVCGTAHAVEQLHNWFSGRFRCHRCGEQVAFDGLCSHCEMTLAASAVAAEETPQP